MEGCEAICDEETKQGHLQRVEVLQQEVRGELAQVHYTLYYADGSTMKAVRASFETLALKDRTVEGGVAENPRPR